MADLRTVSVETVPPYPVRVGPDALTASTDLFEGADALVCEERVGSLEEVG